MCMSPAVACAEDNAIPYLSASQRRYFHAAQARGEIPAKTVNEFDKASKGKDLPERVKMAEGGEVCPHCGRAGYDEGGEVDIESALADMDRKVKEYSESHAPGAKPDDVPDDARKHMALNDRAYRAASGYAEGGEVEDPILGKKKEAELPEMNLDVYRGEGVPRGPGGDKEEVDQPTFAEALRRKQRRGGSR